MASEMPDNTTVCDIEKTKKCSHHCIINSADGVVSYGVCEHCGSRDNFYNSILDEIP